MADNRSDQRSNVYLAAVVDTGVARTPVKLRNLSPRGALIECKFPPPVGTTVRLVRAELEVSGLVAWVGQSQAGVTFDDVIVVAPWIRRIGHPDQQRVDRMIADVERSRAASVPDPIPLNFAQIVSVASADLDRLCKELINSSDLSLELGEYLVALDAISQKLRAAARDLTG